MGEMLGTAPRPGTYEPGAQLGGPDSASGAFPVVVEKILCQTESIVQRRRVAGDIVEADQAAPDLAQVARELRIRKLTAGIAHSEVTLRMAVALQPAVDGVGLEFVSVLVGVVPDEPLVTGRQRLAEHPGAGEGDARRAVNLQRQRLRGKRVVEGG